MSDWGEGEGEGDQGDFILLFIFGFFFVLFLGGMGGSKVMAGVYVAAAAAACAAAAVVVANRVKVRSQKRTARRILQEFQEACETPVARLRQVVDAMAVEMHAGLVSEGGSKLKMLPAFVDRLPDG